MIKLVADANIEGHIAQLIARMQVEPWRGFWDYLHLQYVTFGDLGLSESDTDRIIWQRCQDEQVILLTNNRNDDGPDSLESTILRCNMPTSLPVFTIGNADNILQSGDYANRVIDTLLIYLLDLENARGTGRLYLP